MDPFFALAEPNRRSIIELLASSGELSASAIASHFKITAAAVSQHLKVLREAGLVVAEKRAQKRIYRLNKQAISQLEKWVQQLSVNYDQLDQLLNKED